MQLEQAYNYVRRITGTAVIRYLNTSSSPLTGMWEDYWLTYANTVNEPARLGSLIFYQGM